MSRHWREKFDADKHRDYMVITDSGGVPVARPADNLRSSYVYFVTVCGFTFQFLSLDQIRECLDFFSEKIHPSSRFRSSPLSHWYHAWHERLPQTLFEEAKRSRVIKALEWAMLAFASERCDTRTGC
jgi:hypothetical protein